MTPVLMVREAGRRLRPASKHEILESASAYIRTQMIGTLPLDSPAATARYLIAQLSAYEHEVFGMIVMDNRHRCIDVQHLFRGTIDGASVHPREVVKAALVSNASSVIFFHNHPSGVCEPSTADELITRRLREALALIDIRVLDHIIVAGQQTLSFAERGLL